MAGRSGDNNERRRNRGRKPPVIEMTAVDMTPPAQTSETPPPAAEAAAPQPETESEPARQAEVEPAKPQKPDEPLSGPDIIQPPSPPPAEPEKPRLALPLAAAGLVGAIFGAGAGGLAPSLFGGPAADAARLQRVEQSVAEIARRPAPAPSNAAELQALTQRLGAIEAELKRRLDGQDQKIAAAPTPAAGPAVDLRPLSDRIGALDRALAALDQKAEAAAAAARSAASDGIKAVEPQLRELAGRVTQTAARVDATAAAPLFSATEALRQAFVGGRPFALELSALEALGVKPDQLAQLKALADKGAPTLQQLQAAFQPFAVEIGRSAQPAVGGLQGVWDSLVRTRPVGGAPDTAQSLASAVDGALRRGDVAAALLAWEKLPEASRRASEAWAATARQREAAVKSVNDLHAAAIAALKKAAP